MAHDISDLQEKGLNMGSVNKVKLIRDKDTCDYYSSDNHYWLERCLSGWDVHEIDGEGRYAYSFSVDTLAEFRLIVNPKEKESVK